MASPVVARIVIAQVGNSPPSGYVSGGRDDIGTGALVTATNADNAGALGFRWRFTPCASIDAADYSVSGVDSESLTFTPPDPDGFGDCALTLTVYGAPLPDGRPNIATDTAIVGIRAPAGAYGPGIPIPSELETGAGGAATLSPDGGRERRLQEALYAVAKQALAGGGGGGGGSFSGITLDDPVASFSSTAKFVGYDGVYFTTSGTEIGWNLNGTLAPPSWTSMVTDGWVLYIAPAAGTGKKIELYAQPSTDGIGGSIGLFSGDGATSNGSVKWGRQSVYGDVWESGRLTTAGIEFCREESSETSSTIGGGATGDFAITKRQASASRGMAFLLTSDIPDGDHAFEALFRFSYNTNSSLRTPLAIGHELVRVSGAITQAQPEVFSPSELDVTSECAPTLTTSSTAATLITSKAIATNRVIAVTVDCLHDNGTATGRTVYTAVFRRGAGSATTETAAVDVTPSSAMKKSHAVTITLNSNTIEVKVVAAAATSTKHRAQVAWAVGSIA